MLQTVLTQVKFRWLGMAGKTKKHLLGGVKTEPIQSNINFYNFLKITAGCYTI